MKLRLHTRIFIPIFLILLILPAAAWISFSTLSGWYLQKRTVSSASKLMKEIRRTAEETCADADPAAELTKEQERKYAAALLPQLRKLIRGGDEDGNLLVIGSRFQLVYPSDEEAADTVQELFAACRDRLQDGGLQPHVPTEMTVGGRTYYILLHEIPSSANIRVKYLFSYAQVPDIRPLANQVGRLLILITAVCIFIAALLIWLVMGSITRPLEALSRQAELIGNGRHEEITEHYSVQELENLKEAINRMSANIQKSEDRMLLFFQNVSHDLRTPLATIGGYAQGIQCGVLKEPEKAAGIILTESTRMTGLVESILMLSKLDSRVFELHMMEIPLKDFLTEQAEILGGSAGGKRILVDEGSPSVNIQADAQLLIRIVQNVLMNCLQYAESSVTVGIETDGEKTTVRVEDDGRGIDENDLPYIFDRFYKGKNGNFGIGLSIVKSGMEYMHGTAAAGNRKAPAHGAVYLLSFSGKN